MSEIPELLMDIEPGAGTSLRVSVRARGLAPIVEEVERALPTFPAGDLDELRRGGASERVARQMAHLATTWLLQSDLRGHLGTALRAAAEPLRIVVRPHPKLLADLAEVPFELLEDAGAWLVLEPKIRAIVHVRRPDALAPPPVRTGWPLGVLLVRADPADLGGAVPPILPLAARIRALAEARGLAGSVEVTALTSEPGGGAPVTYDALRRALREERASVLVFLGHGDLLDEGLAAVPPIGVLQFELAGSPYAHPVRADQLRSELANHPVPVVVLAGCSTAASVAAARVPQWMRGSQSVAEALVYGDAGVQCAVGMRYGLEATDADRFLGALFRSLLVDAPGDVERAVRAGREELFAERPFPPSWSAPAIFRASFDEPTFPWMALAPELVDPLEAHDDVLRRAAFEGQSLLPPGAPVESRAFSRRLLDLVTTAFLERSAQRGARVVWPPPLEARPSSVACACVTLASALEVVRLSGRLTFPAALGAVAARPAPALRAAGFRALFALDEPGEARFVLERAGGPAPIAPGPLFEIDLSLPAAAPAVHALAVDGLTCEPRAPLRGWSGAVVVAVPC